MWGGARSKGEASGGKQGPKARQVGGARIKARQVGGVRSRSETSGGSTGPTGKAKGSHATSTTEWRHRATSTAEQQSRATSTAEQQDRATSTAEQQRRAMSTAKQQRRATSTAKHSHRATSTDKRSHQVTVFVLLGPETPQGVGGREPDTAGTLLQRREVRFVDTLLNFLLVWYYCTLTIRESILISNGSRIKGWWVFHHYISTFLSGVMLTWPDGELYEMFRNQFLAYCLYQSFVQFLQYYYQSGCLYRLKALGERHNMDLTVEGFQSWMWRGLTFLLPFLFFGHFWQLFNGISLFRMARLPACKEWQ
ncbi:hypothetical protein QTP86_014531, partial [Hemibagrus guttatus]